MKKLIIAALVSFLFVVACQRVPFSGRNQLILVNSKGPTTGEFGI